MRTYKGRVAAIALLLWTMLVPVAGASAQDEADKAQSVVQHATQKIEDRTATNVDLPGKAAMMAWIDPSVTPWAAVLCIHGLGYHKESYSALGRRLSRVGVAVYAIDVRGFGVYKETKRHAKVDFEQSFGDVKEAVTCMHAAYPKLPVYVLGESMGGAMALQCATRYPELVNGVVSSVPSFNSLRNLPFGLKVALIGMTRGLHASVAISPAVVDKATDNPTLAKRVLNNPATRHYLSVEDLIAYRRLMSGNGKASKQLTKTPILIVQGFKDKLIGPRSTTKLFNRIVVADKDLVLIGAAEHLVFEEGQFGDDTIDTVVSWLNKHNHEAEPYALLPSQISKLRSPVKAIVGDGSVVIEK
ncbi:MAG TPA: alpha/beta fold hydrolase [Planktothrix sp.]|jgi:alpha-beta hydrolase superfamily lysophospholipase